MKGGKSSPAMNEATLGEEKRGGAGGCKEHNEEKELIRQRYEGPAMRREKELKEDEESGVWEERNLE